MERPIMTAAPTPRDGEREHYESHKDLYDVADDCVMLVPDRIKLSVTMWRRAVRPIVEKLAAHVAQRVAEAVGPLEEKITNLEASAEADFELFHAMRMRLTEASGDPYLLSNEALEKIIKARDTLAALVVRLKEALEGLRDEQNGPPLVQWEVTWNAAMTKVAETLALVPADLADSVCVKRSEWDALAKELQLWKENLGSESKMSGEPTGDLQESRRLWANVRKERDALRATVAALEAENRALREALRPFAHFSAIHRSMRQRGNLVPRQADDQIYSIVAPSGEASITVEHVDAAFCVLAPKEGK